jgi:hypothetical protein
MDGLVAQIGSPDISFSPWQTALTARYFAGNRAHPARDRILKHLLQRFQSDPGSAHPRQLTAFNLGRMALALEEASTGTALLEQSIELCFSPNAGPTIRVMALLPISFLPDSALPSPQQIHTWEQTICSAAARLVSFQLPLIFILLFHSFFLIFCRHCRMPCQTKLKN